MSVFSSRKERRKGVPADWLIVGLGNPGAEYIGTRHNVGADVVTAFSERCGVSLKKSKYRAMLAGVNLRGSRLVIAFPLTYMNNSGESVGRLVSSFGIEDPERVIIIHDELDLPVGQLRIKAGGGLAGHNGLKSVKQHLGTAGFKRIRIGIDRPSFSQPVSGYVLRKPAKKDQEATAASIERAADALEHILEHGCDSAMVEYNKKT